jgi:hypothetical protein
LQEDKEGTDLGVLKNVMAHNWVEPSKRERKRVLNYSEAEYYKQVRPAVVPCSGSFSQPAVCRHAVALPYASSCCHCPWFMYAAYTLSCCQPICHCTCPTASPRLSQALKTGKSDRAATRIGKMPAMADFQFFNTRRLTELYEREHAAEQHKQLMAQKEATLRGQVRCNLGLGAMRFRFWVL